MDTPQQPPYRTIDREIATTLEQNNLNGNVNVSSPACRELLAAAMTDETTSYIDESYETKLRGRPYLLDNPAKSIDAEKKQLKKQNRKRDFLAGRSDRKKRLYKIAEEKLLWKDFVALHKLWQGYMEEVLSLDKNKT